MKPDHADEIIAQWRSVLPEIAGLPLELVKRTARLNALLDAKLSAENTKLRITKAEYEVLATLLRSGAPYHMTPTDLADSLLLSSGGTSNVIRRLSSSGYVDRVVNDEDGRSSLVQLTERGRIMAETAVRSAVSAQSALLDTASEHTTIALSNALREMLVALGDEASDTYEPNDAPARQGN